jgi:antirestriction protein ArdC
MNRSQIEAALERNLPFTLRMADGKAYHVPHRDYISLPPKGAFVVVYDDQEHVFVLPLITMTGLTYQSESAKAKGPPAS